MSVLRLALLPRVFATDAPVELVTALEEARREGAELVLLPELPLQPWCPVRKEVRDADAEEAGSGPRQAMLADAAREAGVAVVGGAILRDGAGRRHNVALVVDARGHCVAQAAKVHLPQEPGFWETSHYEPGDALPPVVHDFALPFAIQICSDIQRPGASHALAARGAQAILVPRATEAVSYERWKLVLRSTAITACAYVVSVNRPGPDGVGIGGPSVVIAPDGETVTETEGPRVVTTLSRSVVDAARARYPGYLPVRSALYAGAWSGAPDTGPR